MAMREGRHRQFSYNGRRFTIIEDRLRNQMPQADKHLGNPLLYWGFLHTEDGRREAWACGMKTLRECCLVMGVPAHIARL